jgi:hypothetical protein
MLLGELGEELARQRRDVGPRQALEQQADPRRSLGGDEAELRRMAADRIDELRAWRTSRSRWPASIRAACSSVDFAGTKRMCGRLVASHSAAASAASFLPRAT